MLLQAHLSEKPCRRARLLRNFWLTLYGVATPVIAFPVSGIYAISWNARFNNLAAENGIWFAPMTSSTSGETSNNSNSYRLGYNATYSAQNTTSYTGYFAAGDTLALCAYSSVSNQIVTFGTNGLYITLVSRSA